MAGPEDATRDVRRVRCRGWFSVRGALADVVPLFTAEGERLWAPGWEPVFPLPDHRHERGEVWTTHGSSGQTVWVTADRRADGVLLARVAPGLSAGLVDVRCYPGPAGTTDVLVEYDLTALGDDGPAALDHLQRGFEAMLDSWRATTQLVLDGAVDEQTMPPSHGRRSGPADVGQS